jgi:hypothetical protein
VIMTALLRIKLFMDYVGASREELEVDSAERATLDASDRVQPIFLPWLVSVVSSAWFRGFWWILLLAVIVIFSGQTSKFIYIDF